MADAGYFDLGPWFRQISTRSPEAQVWFNRGLNWTYGFNQEEAVACFKEALAHDPDCAMAWWGIAYCAGPFYNRTWAHCTPAELREILSVCYPAARRAVALSENCTPAERALIRAIPFRYQQPSPQPLVELNRWLDDFASEMRRACRAIPEDLDIASLYAEAALTRTPRQLWDVWTGDPKPHADTEKALEVLETALAQAYRDNTPHPGVLHMYIHLMEMSVVPEKALEAADRLRGLAPDAGHLQHMPAHIYVLCGDYMQAIEFSRKALEANAKYVDHAGADNFYTTSRCHDLHLYMHAAMLLGHYGYACHADRGIREIATTGLVERSQPYMSWILDGYRSMRTHRLVRFGRWRELVLEPAPEEPDLFPFLRTMRAYGCGIAHSALGNLEEAEASLQSFHAAQARIDGDSILLNNPALDVFAVGEAMLRGELEYRKRNYSAAFCHLRRAVELDDDLNYTEPWAWMHPPRHALGALLCEQEQFAEAEGVYRADLGYDRSIPRCVQHPENIWALRGLVECVEQAGRDDEARELRQRLDAVRAHADIDIHSSCACRGLQFPTPPNGSLPAAMAETGAPQSPFCPGFGES